MSDRIEMTRKELWELIWSMPLSRATATFPMARLALVADDAVMERLHPSNIASVPQDFRQ